MRGSSLEGRTRWWRRRSTPVALIVLACLTLIAVTTQTWMWVQMERGGIDAARQPIPGTSVVSAVVALALVSAAGALVATIAGRVARALAAAAICLSAAVGVWMIFTVLADPGAAARGPGSALFGVAGVPLAVQLTPYVGFACGLGVVTLGAGVWLFFTQGAQAHRYETATTSSGDQGEASTRSYHPSACDEVQAWDMLSRGQDPTVEKS